MQRLLPLHLVGGRQVSDRSDAESTAKRKRRVVMNSFCTQHIESGAMAAARFDITPYRLQRDKSQAMAAAQFSITPFRLHRSENQAMAVARFGITPYHPERNSCYHTTGVCLAQFSITPFKSLHRSENQAMAAAQFGLTPYHPERNSCYHTTGVCFDSTPSQCKEFVQEDTGAFGGAFGLKVNGSEEFVEEATRHMGLKPNPDDKTFTCSGKVYEYSDISFLKERNRKFLENLSHLSDMFEEGSSPLTALQAIRSRGEAIVILEDSQGDVIFEANKDFHVPKDFGNNEELQSALDESLKS